MRFIPAFALVSSARPGFAAVEAGADIGVGGAALNSLPGLDGLAAVSFDASKVSTSGII
jgi:hypothetical protein